MTAIDPHIMKQINCFIQTLAPLHPQAAYRIAVVEAYNTQKHVFKGMFLVQAPYYLVLSAKDHPFAAVNAGYVMEQLVLYLVSKGFATCYLGDAKSKPDLDQYQPMIVVAFGKAAATAVKKPASRKKLTELVNQPPVAQQNARKIIEAARIAPSAFTICIQSPALAFYAAGWKNSYLYEKRKSYADKAHERADASWHGYCYVSYGACGRGALA